MDEAATWYGSRPRHGHIVLDGFPALRERGTAPPLLGPCLLWPQSPISATAELVIELQIASSFIEAWTLMNINSETEVMCFTVIL